ncbi:chorismate mutase [Streptomyces sp. NPDC020917]|uniref:chorismate mutase n=1 Tax=Streptomyces sp. NPDC020917 TaxID=3365102 RepID=UPI0037ABD05F
MTHALRATTTRHLVHLMNCEPSNNSAAPSRPAGRLGPLVDLVVQRLRVSDDVAAAKFRAGSPIDDPARERQVLDQVRRQAGVLGLDPVSTTAFFQDQITASKVVQRGLLARWSAHPEEAPTTPPDLGQIRTRLDRLTVDMLRGLRGTVRVRDEPDPCTAHLAAVAGSGGASDRLDTLHRRALLRAVHSVCASRLN